MGQFRSPNNIFPVVSSSLNVFVFLHGYFKPKLAAGKVSNLLLEKYISAAITNKYQKESGVKVICCKIFQTGVALRGQQSTLVLA